MFHFPISIVALALLMIPTLLHDLMKTVRPGNASCPDLPSIDMVPTRPRAASEDRQASRLWDHKRQTCHNCKHVYLISLSTTPNYCSVDCKSNALYLQTVSLSLRAAKKEVIDDNKADGTETKVVKFGDAPTIVATDKLNTSAGDCEMGINDVALAMGFDISDGPEQPQTFAEFHTRKLACRPVEWSFSALY
uniref:Secreted protein n=1 Tax=Achlya hypogyna TaxID=1202772 RepID=A0A0A7CN42_ACHHY|nr:secreted protein [Achlya hypogyna]